MRGRPEVQNYTPTELDFKSCPTKRNLDCNNIFPIKLAPNGIPFGAEYIGKVYLQSKFVLVSKGFKSSYACTAVEIMTISTINSLTNFIN